MSPIYESEKLPLEQLEKLRKRNLCKQCGARLDMFIDLTTHKNFLACHDYLRTRHEGIEREVSRYEREGLAALTIIARRKIMEKEFGQERMRALAKYEGVTSLSKRDALEIWDTIWPEAPAIEKTRAALLCATQQLNPLMKHVFLIPFNKGKENETWETIIGIKAKRLMASRRGPFSYIDDTPRLMTEAEQVKRWGSVHADKLVVIVKLKDPKTGAEAPGYGEWPLKKLGWRNNKQVESDNEPYGVEKGNSKFNMATIHAESQALDRLRPGEMPTGFTVADESIADSAGERGFDVESTATEVHEDETGGDRGDSGGGFSDADKERIQSEMAKAPEFKTGPELFTWGSKQGLAVEEMRQATGVSNPADIKDVGKATRAVAALIPR